MTPQAQRLLQLSLPNLRDYAIVLFDPTGHIVAWLAGAEQIFGYREEEIVGCHSATLFVPEDVELGLDRYELDLARQNSYSEDDRWHLRADGTRIWVTGTVTAVREESGELCGFLKIMRDRTDLRMRSENRSNQLSAVEAAMERTRRFLQTLGHELRNPLAPIRNCTTILMRASDDPRIHKVAQTIVNQVSVLERIASDLMDVSRLQHRKLELRLSEFDVRALLEEEVAGQAARATAKGLQLECLLPDQPLPVLADPDRIRQAVSNLLTNAIKYTPEGGSIWVKATQEADDILLRVQDTGIGIAPEILPRIFELFTQEPRASDLVPGGLGVGLAIVNQIAELHGGVAQARSGGSGKGSEFMLRIPRWGPGHSEARATAVPR
ncbi:PAS domain-containing sensor histidine kinase [Ramlibacter sp.]|uniref:PAS domain-containing sensor histidine kinase n=1 Tax=Ramlibacter sp. TaxID=1917967 RepID=UPI002604DA7D|nr:PAS domain-containing sensor histidine kinase [Ramlibacter sp.]MDB5958500.1 putative histidine kinase, classic [Ramlibacter sp.]